MLAAHYVIAAMSLFFVCDGVTNQNKYSAHTIDSDSNNLSPNAEDDPTLGSRGPIKFEEADHTKHPVKFTAPVSNQIENDLRQHDTKVLFQDNDRPGVNAVTNQIDNEVPRDPKPLRFTDSSNPTDTKVLFNTDEGSTSATQPASDNVGPLKFVDDVARFPQANVFPGGASQIVFEKDQMLGMRIPQGMQNQPHQGQQQKKRRRRRKRLYRRRFPVAAENTEDQNRPLNVVQDVMTMIVDNDKKKCTLRMFCEQAHELTTQPKDTINNLRTAISSIADFFKVLPTLKDKLGLQVGKLADAMKEFANAGFTGQTKGVAACREAYPECPSDPIEMANYLLSFRGGFTRFFNGENYTQHNAFTLNRELGFETVKTGNEHEKIPSDLFNERVLSQIAYEKQQAQLNNLRNQQNYQTNYQHNYQPNYQQSYQLNQPYPQMSYGLLQNNQPNYQYQQSNQLQYQQNYPPYYQNAAA